MIDSYEFGSITIEGRRYDRDVIVHPGGVRANWWRKEGHRLDVSDLEEILADPPQVLIVGTGYFGRMAVPLETLDSLRRRGIEVIVLPTREAVACYNELAASKRVVAALHLTC